MYIVTQAWLPKIPLPILNQNREKKSPWEEAEVAEGTERRRAAAAQTPTTGGKE